MVRAVNRIQNAPLGGLLVLLGGLSMASCADGIQHEASTEHPWELQSLGSDIYVSAVSDSTAYSRFANSLIVVGDDAVLVVDTRDTEEASRNLLAEVRRITDKPVRYIVNTHWHWDHTNGNAVFEEAFPKVEIVAHPETARLMAAEGPGRIQGEIDRLEARVARLEGYRAEGVTESGRPLEEEDYGEIDRIQQADRSRVGALAGVRMTVPTRQVRERWQPPRLGRDVLILASTPAHTPGDLVVWVPDAGVLFMGDLIEHGLPFPGDGTALGHAKSLNDLATLGADTYLPAHGPAASNEALFEGQRAFWNEVDQAFQGAAPDSAELAQLVDRLAANVDPTAFPGAVSSEGEATAGFRDWVDQTVRQAHAERTEGLRPPDRVPPG